MRTCPIGAPEAGGERGGIAVRPAREGNLVDEQQLVPALGHQPGLEALARAEDEDLGIRIALAQRVGDREQRIHVPGSAATGEEVRRHPPTLPAAAP